MATITITGCDPYDGALTLDFEQPFTTGELNIIKNVAGVRSQEVEEALEAGDTDLIVAFAVIALARCGRATRRNALAVAEKLWDADSSALKFEPDETEKESDARPPAPSVNGDVTT